MTSGSCLLFVVRCSSLSMMACLVETYVQSNQEGLVGFIDGTDPKEMLRIVRSHGHAGVGAWSSRSRLNKGTFEL